MKQYIKPRKSKHQKCDIIYADKLRKQECKYAIKYAI